jgi:hypothetical protein
MPEDPATDPAVGPAGTPAWVKVSAVAAVLAVAAFLLLHLMGLGFSGSHG